MKKTEIIQVAIIIIGVLAIVRTLEALLVQLASFLNYADRIYVPDYWLAVFVGVFLLVLLIGYLMIKNSNYFANKIIQEDSNIENLTISSRREVIAISIVILSLYYLIFYFSGFVSSVYISVSYFITDYMYFKDMFTNQIWRILQYIVVVILFLKANYVSRWIEDKIINQEKENLNLEE